jgi:hypothetical protein
MGRIVDLCVAVAAAGDEGPEGLVLPLEAREQLLGARLIEMLGTYGDEKAYEGAVSGEATLDLGEIRQLAHRLDRLEEILDEFRDVSPPDRRGFEVLKRRLLDHGIEEEMRPDWEKEGDARTDQDETEH